MTHYLSSYARFTNKEEMDVAVFQHVELHWNTMNKTDRAVLEMIRCYSVKYLASHLKHQTIETKLGLSNSTVRRALRKLEKLEIIERIHFVRPIMSGLGANIYVILPVNDQGKMDRGEQVVEPNEDVVSKTITGNEPSFYKSQNTKEPIKTSHLEDEKLSTTLFARMKELLSLTGDDSKTREFFGIYRALTGRLMKFELYQDSKELFEDLGYRAMYISVMATKKKKIRNLPGYFSGVLREMIDEAFFKDIHREYTVSVEELYFT
ncbi:winged helix-turn-helix transcriptional regulator [Sporosarcina obsidiansis]|uniref:winged helix-turn-helix transcriptional regulator n=1 Tax=Sporosarcina obsidiansis TaxID=2660748 RepID=UPI00129B0CD8|nr:winged helix-turn-helix transcriptional regulator [Sporosarcina obsidiansis]